MFVDLAIHLLDPLLLLQTLLVLHETSQETLVVDDRAMQRREDVEKEPQIKLLHLCQNDLDELDARDTFPAHDSGVRRCQKVSEGVRGCQKVSESVRREKKERKDAHNSAMGSLGHSRRIVL